MPFAKYFLYKVSLISSDPDENVTLEQLINNWPKRPVSIFKNGNEIIASEVIQNKFNLYYGFFVLIQKNQLPPKVKVGEIPEDILTDDEDAGLGHYTSFIYDPSNHIICIQQNKNGVTANGIAYFLKRNFEIKEALFEIVIDPEDLAKVSKMSKITSFEISIAKPTNGESFLENRGSSIKEITNWADDTDANVLTLKIGMGYERSASLRKSKIIDTIRSIMKLGQGEIRKIEIKGAEKDEDNLAVLDLINNRVNIVVQFCQVRSMTTVIVSQIVDLTIKSYLKDIKPKLNSFKVKAV